LVDAKNEVLALHEVLRQKDDELSSLRDTVWLRDDSAQQLTARLDAATRDYALTHEECRQLREKVRQYEETIVTERADHAAMLNELRGESAMVERESARLSVERLHKENEQLRRWEAESAEVMGRLMADVEAAHRGVGRSADTITFTKQEHDAAVERQLLALRAELEEMFGADISRMKDQMRDHYSATIDQLRRELSRSEEERSQFASQVSLWQQQYMALSQQGVSSVDITQRLNDAVADNVHQRQRVVQLTSQVEQLNAQLSLSLSSSQPAGSETSSELDVAKSAETRSMHVRIDELRSQLSEACEERDRSIGRSQTAEQDLEALRQELLSTRSQHSATLQQIEAKAATDIARLSSELASTNHQLKTVELSRVESGKACDELQRILQEKESQFETFKLDYEQLTERLQTEKADAVELLSKQLESEHAKLMAAADDYRVREQKSLTLIEELQAKYEMVHKENIAFSEQLQHQNTPSDAVSGGSDVDSVVAHLSSQLEKVTRERDSAMQSLQTVYGDRIELQQTIKTLESERNSLTNRVNQLDAERQSHIERLAQTDGEVVKLKHSAVSSSASRLSMVGTGSVPDMPSVTDEAGTQGPDVIDSLRAEFEELRRLRCQKDRSSSLSSAVATHSVINVPSQSDVSVDLRGSSVAVDQNVSVAESEDLLSADEIATLKQEYSALCAELVRLREMLITLQRVDREREQVRSQFELEVRLLRDELLRRDRVETASVTESAETALNDELKVRDVEIDSLKGRLAMTLSRIEELIDEKDQQCAVYEHELEEVREEHCSALKRIDALVQEHNILIGGQVPLSSFAPKNVHEIPVVVHSETLENDDEDVSPRRVVYENQAKEIEHLREQLHKAAQEMVTLSLDRDRLNEVLESETTELLARLERAGSENAEQRQMYERRLAVHAQDVEQLNRRLDAVLAELEQSKTAHVSELRKLRGEYDTQFDELSFSNDEVSREQQQELSAVHKQCADLQSQLESVAAEKASMEQEYVSVLNDITKENSARISALHKDFEQELALARLESEKAHSEHAVQLEEELRYCRQEITNLKQSLELYEGGVHHSSSRKSGDEDLETVQVLQLRINDLTETKDKLQHRLDLVTSENERLSSEVETLLYDKETLRSQVLASPRDYPQSFVGLDTESAADTSGDSHVFCTTAKSRRSVAEKLKSLQAEKELLTNMVDRLNAEKEQLMSDLITRQEPTHVFEADIQHLELSSQDMVEVSQGGNSAEVRIKALESEKELLAGILEKVSREKDQLLPLTMTAGVTDLDMSYDDGLSGQFDVSIEKSVILDTSEESEVTVNELTALRNDNAMLRAKVSDLESHISSVSNLMYGGQKQDKKMVGMTVDVELADSSVQTSSCPVDEDISTTSDQSDIDDLHRTTVQQMSQELDVARSELLSVKKGICTLMGTNVPVDDSQLDISADNILGTLDAFIHRSQHENATSEETVLELRSQIAELNRRNVSAATEALGILSEIDPSSQPDIPDVDVTDSTSDALSAVLRLLKENIASSGVLSSSSTASSLEPLLAGVTRERDQLNRELEDARQLLLLHVGHTDESTSFSSEQTVDSLINRLIQEKNNLAESAVERAESTSEAVGSHEVDIVEGQRSLEHTAADRTVEDIFADTTEYDRSLSTEGVDSERVRMLEERLSNVSIERDKLTADLSHVVQQCVELKASRADVAETTKRSIEALKNELERIQSDHELLVARHAASDVQLTEVKAERDELSGEVDALQHALTLAMEGKNRLIQSRSQLPATPVSISVEDQKSQEASSIGDELTQLRNRVEKLELERFNLLDEKESVAEQYGKTVDELKVRLVDMQATVESLQSEDSVKTQEHDAAVRDLMSRLQAAEMMCSSVDEECRQKQLDLAELQLRCEEKQRIIDEVTGRLQFVGVNRPDDEGSGTENSLVSIVHFLQSEISRLGQQCDQLSSDLRDVECKKGLQSEGGRPAKESQSSLESTGTDSVYTGSDGLLQVDSVALRIAKPQTKEQHTMTEKSSLLGVDSMHVDDVSVKSDLVGTAYFDEDVSALQQSLHKLTTELDSVRKQRDEYAARVSQLEQTVLESEALELQEPNKPELTEDANIAVAETGIVAASTAMDIHFAQQSNIRQLEDTPAKTDKATDHKESYLRLHSRQCIAVSDNSLNVRNITEWLPAETSSASVETHTLPAQNVDRSLQRTVDELLMETRSLKEERDLVTQKLMMAEMCIRETQESSDDKIQALNEELTSLREELCCFETRCKALENERQETAETWLIKHQKLTEELHAVGAERDHLSAEVESAKCDLQQSLASVMEDAARDVETLNIQLVNAAEEKSQLSEELAGVYKTCTELRSELEFTAKDRNSLMVELHEVDADKAELKKSATAREEALVISNESLEKECCRWKEENARLSERSRSAVESELQRALALQTENDELIQSKELLLSENGSLKQLISEYINKLSTVDSSKQSALENWKQTEEQLLARINGLEVDLSAMEEENSTLKSEVDRIPMLAVERDDAHKRCVELAAQVARLQDSMEALSSKFSVTSLELAETRADLARHCDEAECEAERLQTLVDEKTRCVLDLQTALARTEKELVETQEERESLASQRNALKEQIAVKEAAMSELKSQLSITEMDSDKLEQLEQELSVKSEELKVAEGRLRQQQETADDNVSIDALQLECESLRKIVSTYELDANNAQQKLSQMEGLCLALTAERDELARERCTLHAENNELSSKLVLLQQQLEGSRSQTALQETEAVEPRAFVEQLDTVHSDDVKLDVDDDKVGKNVQIVDAKDQLAQVGVETLAELKIAGEAELKLEIEPHRLQLWDQETGLDTVAQEMDESQPDTARCLQLELDADWSSRSTEGLGSLETRLQDLDLTDRKSDVSSVTGEYSVHASRTFTKLVPSVVVDLAEFSVNDGQISPVAEPRTPPGGTPESNTGLPSTHTSPTYTELVSTDTFVCQTATDDAEIDANDLYRQIDRLQLELEQQKSSHDELQTNYVEFAKADDALLQESTSFSEQWKEICIGTDASSMTNSYTTEIETELRAVIEAKTKQIEALETEYQSRIAALTEECNRQVSAAENCARAKIVEFSLSESSVVESVQSTDSDSTTDRSDVIGQLRLDLAAKTTQLEELRREIDHQKTSLSPSADVEADLDEERQRSVANLESQLLMSTEENERLQQKINELEQRQAKELNTVRQEIDEQHLTEMRVLEFRLQKSYEQSLSRARADVAAELEETHRKRKEALDTQFKKKSEHFRKEMEQKFALEFKKVCILIILNTFLEILVWDCMHVLEFTMMLKHSVQGC